MAVAPAGGDNLMGGELTTNLCCHRNWILLTLFAGRGGSRARIYSGFYSSPGEVQKIDVNPTSRQSNNLTLIRFTTNGYFDDIPFKFDSSHLEVFINAHSVEVS